MSTGDWVEIDGQRGEGGGQILRTALALSLVTGRPVRFRNIRARRARPGLRPQHRTAVLAAARVGAARIEGNSVGSTELEFEPTMLSPGVHHFDIGTAGSTTLVLQTILPALLSADAPSSVRIVGGTHNPLAPCFDFLERAFVPLLRRMGADVSIRLERAGFVPAGGGSLVVEVRPTKLAPLVLHERGSLRARRARALLARLPRHIGERELAVLQRRLGLDAGELELVELTDTAGPGNAVLVEVQSENVTELFSAIGERGIRAETVAERVAKETLAYLRADVAVGTHLADQLLLPMALARGGSFTTLAPTSHTRTNAGVITDFVPVRFELEQSAGDRWLVTAVA